MTSNVLDKNPFLEYIKNRFRVVVVDTEFQFDQSKTYPVKVVCFVYRDLTTGETFRVWEKDQQHWGNRLFDFDTTLFVCFYATAEVGCFLKSHQGRPPFIFDCWTEYAKLYKNRRELSVLAACAAYGYPNPMSKEEKDKNRDLIINQNTWTKIEQKRILDYCEKDVDETEHIFYGVLKDLEKYCGNDYETLLEQAMARGQAMACVQKMQDNGIPVDNNLATDFVNYWSEVKSRVIQRFNKKLNLFDENSKFVHKKFEELIRRIDLWEWWPRTPTGKLKTNSTTLEIFEHYPEIKQFKRIKNLVDSAKLVSIIISEDGRLRPYGGFKMFGTHTGRCAPTSKWIFGTSKWGRNIIKPTYGNAVVYLDYKAAEIFVAARLSGDKNLMKAYMRGDPYISMAYQFGLVPETATKESHPQQRGIFKTLNLAANYGMSDRSVARDLKKENFTYSEAAGLMKKFKEKYSTYFAWNERVRSRAAWQGYIDTSMGWDRRFPLGVRIKSTSLANWPIQSESAEVLRNALIRLNNMHLKVCASIHDAFLLECTLPELQEQIRAAKKCMIDAAECVLEDPHNIGGAMGVDEDIHFSNFKQIREDQDIFDTLFDEIDKYKKMLAATKNVAKPYESSSRSLYINSI